jgi:signal transduction histidine kinase
VLGLAGGALLHPIGVQLRTVMDQLLFGGRPDPLDAAARVVDAIGTDPQEALDSLRTALSLPYVALQREDVILASSGEPVPHVRRVQCEDLDLIAGMRPGDLRLSSGDANVLRLVTPLLAQLVRATELNAAVQRSRAQALTGIADERRRLRNELHDELGPTLTGIAFTTDAAMNRLSADPGAAVELIQAARSEVGNAIGQVRDIVYGMRPPALDELGLIAAVQQQARTLGDGLSVTYVVEGDLPRLPAAVEVAAFRIIMEALTNVARHGDQAVATVRFDARESGHLTVEVTDPGAGSGAWRAGVGITSMRERVAELGGTFHAGPGPDGGCVRARIPLDWAG